MELTVIEPMAIARLRPYARNARTHSKKQIRQIADSIGRFGFTNPVLISDDDEIIAGHGRVEAAKLLGMANVPTLKLSHLNAAQRRCGDFPGGAQEAICRALFVGGHSMRRLFERSPTANMACGLCPLKSPFLAHSTGHTRDTVRGD